MHHLIIIIIVIIITIIKIIATTRIIIMMELGENVIQSRGSLGDNGRKELGENMSKVDDVHIQTFQRMN